MAPAGAEATRIQVAAMELRATALLMVPPFLRQASSYSGRREGANRGGRLRGGCSLHPGLGASLPDRPDGQPGHCEHDLGPQDKPGDIHGRLPLPVPLAEDERAYRPGGEAETGPPSLALGGVAGAASRSAADHRGRDDRHPVPLVRLAEHPLHGQGVPRAGDHAFHVHGIHLHREPTRPQPKVRLGLGDLLARVHERHRDHRGVAVAIRGGHPQRRSLGRQRHRDPGETDVPLQPRRPHRRGHVADPLAVRGHRPPRRVHVEALPGDLDADDLPRDPLVPDPAKGVLAHELGVGVEVDEPVQPQLKRVVGPIHVGLVVEDAALDPTDVNRAGRPDLVGPTRLHDPFPQVVTTRGIEQVQLVAHLAGPPGPGNDHRDAIGLGPPEEVVAEVEDALAEQVSDHVLRLRPLDLERRGVDLPDLNVQAGVRGQAERVEEDVGVGQGEPERVLVDPEHHRIVQDPPVRRGDQHVLALPDLTRRQVSARQELGEPGAVRAGHLDVALDRHVPQCHVFEEVPVLLLEVAVVCREQRVVVHGEPPRPVSLSGLEVRTSAQPRSTLNLAHVERHVTSSSERGRHDSPTTRPSLSTSIRVKAGVRPRPGISIWSPHSATTKPAPTEATRSRTGSVKPVGRPFSAGSWDSDRWLLAMHTGSRSRPRAASTARDRSAAGANATPPAPYRRVAIRAICSRIGVPAGFSGTKDGGRSRAASSALARSSAPAPPRAKPSHTATSSAPRSRAASASSPSSASASPSTRFTATTAGTPNAWTLSMCAARLATPRSRADGSGPAHAVTSSRPPCIRSARTVATITAADGSRPPAGATRWQNFSNPRSEPNPASVTTTSATLRPTRVARTEEFPEAMLPNGPLWRRAGRPSIVWTRFGRIACRSSTAMAPATRRSSAVTGSPPAASPTTIRPRRARRSCTPEVMARMAMTSEAAVITKPVSRGTPWALPPSPTMMWRSARSLRSRARGQVTVRGSMPSGLP